MTHGGAHATFDGSGIEVGVDPRYYLMLIGLVIGIIVVAVFEHFTSGWSTLRKTDRFKRLTGKNSVEEMDTLVRQKLRHCVDGPRNIFQFWTGGVLVNARQNKETYSKAYETLALLCALLFTVSVTFYVEEDSGDHIAGLVGCVANCALWMNTLMSTFLAICINACDSDEQFVLLQGLYGRHLMRVPMMLFGWGAGLIFLQFILFFKLNVDPGLNCSMCLGACLTVFPLFLHCLHKLGWATYLVHGEAEVEKERAETCTPAKVEARLRAYIVDKGEHSVLNLDLDEFLSTVKVPGSRTTSVQLGYAKKMFEAYVESELQKLGTFGHHHSSLFGPVDSQALLNPSLKTDLLFNDASRNQDGVAPLEPTDIDFLCADQADKQKL